MVDNKFTWLPFFKEVQNKIHTGGETPQSLARIANEIFGYIKDVDIDGNEISIEEMSPINFIGYFNRKLTLSNKILYCQKLSDKLNLTSSVPIDFDGIPEFNNQNCLCMSFKKDRANYIIKEQWELSNQILNDNVNSELFNKVLSEKHPYIGLSYLSRFCFIVKPEKYYPFDKQMSTNLGIKIPHTYQEYIEYCDFLRNKYPQKSSYELSNEAWINNKNSLQTKYWIYSAGQNSCKWDEFCHDGIMAIGWDYLGDLTQYRSQDEITQKIHDFEQKTKNPKNDSKANWEFANDVQVGDIVYVKKGLKGVLIGRGIVESDYIFDDSRREYKSIRKVNWTHNGEYSVDFSDLGIGQWAQKTLTEISPSKYKDFCLKIEDIFMDNKNISPNEDSLRNRLIKYFQDKGIKINDEPADYTALVLDKNIAEIHRTHKNSTKFRIILNFELLDKEYQKNVERVPDSYKWTNLNGIFWINSEETLKEAIRKIENIISKIVEERNFNNANIEVEHEKNNMQTNIPLNQILYGPPGTGKTYSVRKYINDIIANNVGLKADNKEQKINNIAKDLNWYSAIALSMYQNGKNNKYKVPNLQYQKIIKAFAATKESKQIKATLWFQMQSHTSITSKYVNNSTKQRPYIFDKTENSEWYLTDEGVRFVEENLSEQLEQLNSKNSQREIEDFYKFITFHQSYSYEEFVEGIKPRIDTDTENSTISYEYNKGIFKEICQQANSDPDNNYLLIIDEINRGNISKIFGELITLIETDKRVTPNGERIFENTKVQNEQLLVTLPYTKSKFGVPKNLYILGTMNTSDRSIASIDIALRRRFKFIEMMPDSQNVPNEEIGDFNLREIFETLNKRISVLLDRDHQIGHSYFMNWQKYDMETLQDVWFDSIMPLLNEYFYGDWDKLRAILGDTIKVESPNDKYSSFLKKVEDVDFAMKYDCDDNDGYDFVNKKEICFEEALKNAFPTIAKNNKPKENVADGKE